MRLRVGGKFGSSGDLGDEGQINRARAASSRRRAGGATPAGPLGAASCNSEIRWSKVRAVESRFDAGWFAATSACAWISAVIVAGASATAEVASSGDWRRARLSTRGSGIIAGDADARDVDGRSKPRSMKVVIEAITPQLRSRTAQSPLAHRKNRKVRAKLRVRRFTRAAGPQTSAEGRWPRRAAGPSAPRLRHRRPTVPPARLRRVARAHRPPRRTVARAPL